MEQPLWLAFDIGTSGVKAALVRDDGEISATAVENYPTHNAEGGVVEQNVEDWWRAIVAACQSLGENLKNIIAICVTGQMQDFILLDRGGMPLYPVILYSDLRAKSEAAEISGKIGADRLLELTGNAQGADSLWAKLLWIRRNSTLSLDDTNVLLFGAADYAVFRLTGNTVTDTTTASTTGLMHLKERRWFETELLTEMGIAEFAPLLPDIVPGGARTGIVREDAAVVLGVPVGIPVFHAPGDAGATTIGAGSGEIGQAYGYLGTSGWAGFAAAEPGSPDRGVFTLAHPRPGQYIQVAPLLTAGGNLEWVRDLLDYSEYSAAIDAALDRPVTQIVYLPYLNGERAPFIDPLARAAFIGMGAGTRRADLVRAVLEGVAFAYRHVLDTLMTEALSQLIMTGGGTRSGKWCQLFADILGVPIVVIEDAENAAVRGAIMSAQVAAEVRADYALEARVNRATTFQPDSANHETYARKYAIYRAAYPALKPLFDMR